MTTLSLTSLDDTDAMPILDDVEVPDREAAWAEFGKSLGNLLAGDDNNITSTVTIAEVKLAATSLASRAQSFTVTVTDFNESTGDDAVDAFTLLIRD